MHATRVHYPLLPLKAAPANLGLARFGECKQHRSTSNMESPNAGRLVKVDLKANESAAKLTVAGSPLESLDPKQSNTIVLQVRKRKHVEITAALRSTAPGCL